MWNKIQKKYKRFRRLAEAKEMLRKNGYSLLLETPVENFEETRGKSFLLDVINNLEAHGYIRKKDIDELDASKGYIWNELNKLARGFNIQKIIQYLMRLGLYRERMAA